MIIALISIWILAALSIGLGVALRRKLCPICAGVFLTWLWMIAGYFFFGYAADERILALLMGGSVVGAAYSLEKRLPKDRSAGLWKLVSVPVGFLIVYAVLSRELLLSVVAVAVLLI